MYRERKTVRLPNYDYGRANHYFVTLCTQHRELLFGDVLEDQMVLNESGQMVQAWIEKIAGSFESFKVHEYIVMPNHIHMIVENSPSSSNNKELQLAAPTLQKVLQWFKTMTTNQYIRGVKSENWQPFNGKLWQRSYHDRIIRGDIERENIIRYIRLNPVQWKLDKDNPKYFR